MESNEGLIIVFFEKLMQHNINYCILRNHEEIPHNVGHDIDMLLDSNDRALFDKQLDDVVLGANWKKLFLREKQGFFTIVLYTVEADKLLTLKLDVWTDLFWRGIKWANSEYILKNKVVVDNLYISSKGSEAAILTLKEMMGKGEIPLKYYSKIISNYSEDKYGFIETLNPNLHKSVKLIATKIESNDFEGIDSLAKKVKSELLFRFYCNVGTILGFIIFELCAKIKKFRNLRGKFIVIMGPDGAGKSSVIEVLKKELTLFYPRLKNYHMRFNYLPTLKTGLGITRCSDPSLNNSKNKINKKEGDGIRKNLLVLLRPLALMFVIIYYTFEFVLGYFTIFNTRKNEGLIIFDRYYYDYFVQPQFRNFIWSMKKILLFLVPTPQNIFYLKAIPEVTHKRKQELCVSEIKKQNEFFMKLIKVSKNIEIINTDGKNVEETAFVVIKKLLSEFDCTAIR